MYINIDQTHIQKHDEHNIVRFRTYKNDWTKILNANMLVVKWMNIDFRMHVCGIANVFDRLTFNQYENRTLILQIISQQNRLDTEGSTYVQFDWRGYAYRYFECNLRSSEDMPRWTEEIRTRWFIRVIVVHWKDPYNHKRVLIFLVDISVVFTSN